MPPSQLRDRFAAARAQGLRHKEAAAACGVSEGEAIAAHAGDHAMALKALPLRGPWIALLQALEACGPLLALTRNASTVHEKTGVYTKLSASGHVGLALGEQIDLRLFLDRWHAGFAVTEAAANAVNPPSLSLQFFDRHGCAAHKVFAREGSDRERFRAVAADFGAPTLAPAFEAEAVPGRPRPDAFFDAAALTADWATMTDTHQFFGLLRKHDVERQQSFRLVEGRFARRLPPATVRTLLQEAAFDGTPIMVFVGSPGCIQIHTGPVKNVVPMDIRGISWLNVLDEGFNLHLREDAIAQAWVVEKPTSDGVVTSVEAFDQDGGLMAMFFGARKPGVPERQEWRALVQRLQAHAEAAA
ncbi:hemin-degrading factor [Ramlibacter pallidus]|uniref:Hemin-degrading factor n=1 Tax=Ramlibacter pallidus TaxID=2780087 RepID=A0ABR9S1Z8_9BURK|nr:ChuX/HutX family heme-like substrate-binding protein [Ramlibacter pallidus]MBE7367129.1 hemin-degrading factor [Ramlibacter pallidus]